MASTNFINECKNRSYANRLGKIIIDGITSPITNSDNLQSFEIDSGCYVDGNIIGSVYAKCLKANFIAEQNNLTDKPIQAQIGVKYTDLSNEYINMGKYKVEHPNNEITANMSQITAYSDLYTNLDSKYICNIDYSTGDKTLSDLYVDVCNQLGLTPVTTTFINSTISITANPFTNGEKNRTVLQTIAKISCSFIDIDNDTNKIDLCWLSSSKTPDYTFYKNDYSSVEGGQVVCGPINCLIIKNSQVDDENVTIKDDESIKANGEHSITISEDYILHNADLRQQAITDIWNRIKGMKYVDCKLTTYYGKPFLKLGDYIRIYTSETEYFDTYVLKHNFTYDGSFASIIESPVLTEQEIKTKQNISLREVLRNTQIIVDKQLGKITSTVDEMNTKVEDITTTTQTSTGGNSLYLKEALESNALEYSIDGKCFQATRSGKNLYNYKDITNVGDGVTADKDGWITIAYDNTNGTSTVFRNYYTNNLNLKTNTNYNIILEVKNVSTTGDSNIYPISTYSTTQGQFINNFSYKMSDLSNNTVKQFIQATKNSFDGITAGLRTFASFGAGVKGSITFRLSVLEDTTVTANNFEYEAFGASPSPDYPSEIKIIKGIRNLLNLNVPTSTTSGITCTNNNDGSITINGHTTAGFAYYLTNDNITFEKGKKYTISAKILSGSCTNYTSSTSWAFKFIADRNNISATVTDIGSTTKEVEKTFDGTNSSAKPYLWFGWNSSTTENDAVFNDLRVQFMVEEGDIKHSYVPHGTYEKIKVTGKNVFDSSLFEEFTTGLKFINLQLKPNTAYTMSSNYLKNTAGTYGNLFFYNTKGSAATGTSDVFLGTSRTITTASDGIGRIAYRDVDNEYSNEPTDYWYIVEEGTEATDYEPYKEKEVLIDLAKENLLETPYTESNKLTATATKNDYYAAIDYYAELEVGKTYTFSCKTDGTFGASNQQTQCYLLFDKKYDYIIHMDDKNCFKFTPTQTGKYYVRYDVNIKGETHSFWDFAIYEGTNADDSYESNSIDDTNDKLELINGLANIQKRIGKVVLNGSENWFKASDTSANYYGVKDIINATKNYDIGLSSHFVNINKYPNVLNTFAIRDNGTSLMFNSSITTLADFKAWLKANPVTVYYILNEPETITLPNTNIPLYEGINHVTLVEDLETTTSIKYLRKTPISGEYALNQDLNKTNSNLADTNNQLSQTQSDIDNTKTNLNNNYYNKEQVDSINSTTTQNITQIRNTMEQNITSTNASISKIQEEITNGVSKVTTTTGTFDENGLNISKSGQPMSSTLDWDGLEVVRDKGKATETEVLTVRSAGVEAENMTVRNFFIEKPIRIEKCKSVTDSTKVGLGFFWIGE